jgi:ADP-dependent NAD(P)H-hydrate dehydratase / NAD(P)H-hydrate epimerase
VRPVVTADEWRRVEESYAGDLWLAMDRAGHAVALAAVRAGASYGKRVVVLTGPGNNGGDGYVAARYLKRRGVFVVVHALAPSATRLGRRAEAMARAEGVPVVELTSPVQCDIVIDALFGGGGRSGMPPHVLEWMETAAPIVAVDYPTGLDPDTGKVAERAFLASETVTFGTLKTGHVRGAGPDQCGVVTVTDIGITGGEPSMFVAEDTDAPRPARTRASHKWSAGAVLVVGGSQGLAGAAVLAGRAASSFGAGTVYLSTPRVDLMQQVAPEIPALHLENAEAEIGRFDVVVAGPGLNAEDAASIHPILGKADRIVLDAGALTPATLAAARQGDADIVITPHDAEFKRLAGVGAGAFSIRSLAMREGITVLRKGNPTMVSDGGPPVLVTTGGPELATIGTGDVLAGMIAALWSRGLPPSEAAVSAAYWHGVAGAGLAEHGSVTADVLAEYITAFAW